MRTVQALSDHSKLHLLETSFFARTWKKAGDDGQRGSGLYFEGIESRGLGVEGFGFRDYRTQNGNCSLGFWVEGIGFRV